MSKSMFFNEKSEEHALVWGAFKNQDVLKAMESNTRKSFHTALSIYFPISAGVKSKQAPVPENKHL